LLDYARETIGAGVTANRHMSVLKDLRVACMLRKNTVLQKGLAFQPDPGTRESRTMNTADLVKAAGSERGDRLKPILLELGHRKGDEALAALGSAAATYDGEIRRLARDLLLRQLSALGAETIRQKLKDDRAEIRAAAAQTVGSKRLRFGSDLIELLSDE